LSDFPSIDTRYPPVLLERRAEIAATGTFRQRVAFDLVERPHHAAGLLAAADVASFTGTPEILAVEFGVAEGAGLLNMAEIAAEVTVETGIRIKIAGFDSGEGLPAPIDYRDHPEIWGEGDFRMGDADALRTRLPPSAELLLGPVATTLPGFVASLAEIPVGFVSFDLDLYSSTSQALALFDIEGTLLLPVVVSYFDDVTGGAKRIGSIFRNEAAGQLLAIKEFNARHSKRIIDQTRILRHRRPLDREPWIDRMYALHVLDHPVRNTSRSRAAMSMTEHGRAREFEWPL
jgi:hypothetical protein